MHVAGTLSVILQVCLIIHVFRTGRPVFWALILFLVPVIGSIVYLLLEVLPDLRRSEAAREIGTGIVRAANPGRELRRLQELLERSDTVHNRHALANAHAQSGAYSEAIALYEECLVGVHKDDVGVLFDLARSYFHDGSHERARETVARLRDVDPDYKHHDRDLLVARCLEAQGNLDQALEEYSRLEKVYPGEEARCRLALLLVRTGERTRARELFEQTIAKAKRSPGYYRKAQREWIRLARQNLK